MKRLILLLALVVSSAVFSFAQQQEGQTPGSEVAQEEHPMMGWMLANFAILAIGLGFLIHKHVPPLLQARSETIQRGIREAAELKAQSESRLAEIEKHLSGIADEIEKLRVELISEMSREGERMRAEMEGQVSRMHAQAEQEIGFMTRAARKDLKAFSAQTAIDLAAQRIRDKMNHDTQHRLVDAFVGDLERAGNRSPVAQ